MTHTPNTDDAMGAGTPVRVGLIDGWPLLRIGVAAALRAGDGVVLSAHGDGVDPLRPALDGEHLDVLLIEPWHDGADAGAGATLLAHLRESYPGIYLVAFSAHREEVHVAAVAELADGYISKDVSPEDLPGLIRHVANGHTLMPRRRPSPLPHPLTAREREVLTLVAHGHSNEQVGRELFVTEQTVKFHRLVWSTS